MNVRALLLASSLSGCSMFSVSGGDSNPDPKTGGSGAPPGISYRINGDDIGDSMAKAKAYCTGYGKNSAKVDKMQPIDKDGERVVSFDCI